MPLHFCKLFNIHLVKISNLLCRAFSFVIKYFRLEDVICDYGCARHLFVYRASLAFFIFQIYQATISFFTKTSTPLLLLLGFPLSVISFFLPTGIIAGSYYLAFAIAIIFAILKPLLIIHSLDIITKQNLPKPPLITIINVLTATITFIYIGIPYLDSQNTLQYALTTILGLVTIGQLGYCIYYRPSDKLYIFASSVIGIFVLQDFTATLNLVNFGFFKYIDIIGILYTLRFLAGPSMKINSKLTCSTSDGEEDNQIANADKSFNFPIFHLLLAILGFYMSLQITRWYYMSIGKVFVSFTLPQTALTYIMAVSIIITQALWTHNIL